MPGFHGEAATVGCQAGSLICLSREGQVVEATAYDRLPSPAILTVACWALVRRLSVLTWQEVKYDLSNLSLVVREHLRSCGGVACAATDQRMAISSRSACSSSHTVVGWGGGCGWFVSLGLSFVCSRIGGLCCFPSQPYFGWVASCERASLSVRRSARSIWVERALRARLRAQ